MRRFSPEDRLIRAEQMPATKLDEETVLMSIDAGAYYGLKGPAQSIWEFLEAPRTFSGVVEELVKSYKVSPEQCAEDLQRFLGEMEQEGLLRVE